MEVTSFLLTFPVGFFAYKFHTERKKPFKNIRNINIFLAGLVFSGLPAFHLYSWTAYRRYF